MRRPLFAILSVLSLALFAATCVLWVRSSNLDIIDRIFWIPRDSNRMNYLCLTENGSLWLIRAPHAELRHIDGDNDKAPLIPGIRYATRCFNYNTHMAWISFWYPATFFLGMAAWSTRKWWTAGRSRNCGDRICTVCGYDIRATPGRCPECGMIQNAI